MSETKNKANRLIEASSPYLLQHAYNPVDWYPWGEEALEKAKTENKPIIVSIGYSSCHWCHVMERESFEDKDIADLMNEYFVCIKVDREERPDLDNIYMEAASSMGSQTGWPLNVFLTPDTKPFFAGTYFPPKGWTQALGQIGRGFDKRRSEYESLADRVTKQLNTGEVEKYKLHTKDKKIYVKQLNDMMLNMAGGFDEQKGGFGGAPKFPLPQVWLFMLRYYHRTRNENVLNHTELTLEQMAMGGIYDQLGGGFARYSVDRDWFVPHFEKMLYDNAQLLSVYSEAYTVTKEYLYKEVVYETIDFLERDMMDKEGGFYSALDADSEGEEGKYYLWKEEEIETALGDEEAELFKNYFNTSEHGNWEEAEYGKNILFRVDVDEDFAEANGMEVKDFRKKLEGMKKALLKVRKKRTKPGLDDKIITSWNGLTLKGLCDAYTAFKRPKFREMAVRTAEFIHEKLTDGNRLFRIYKNGKASIPGFLDDYAMVIEGYIALYQISFDIKWLKEAFKLTEYCFEAFYFKADNLFFYSDKNAERLIASKKEIFDNVMPSSNSVMANNLHKLSLLLHKEEYKELSEQMLVRVSTLLEKEPRYVVNWATLFLSNVVATAEVVVVGEDYEKVIRQLDKHYLPNKVVVASAEKSDELPLLEGREAKDGKTTIYVCRNRTCQEPVHSTDKAVEQIDIRTVK